jgi:hypothetical protein
MMQVYVITSDVSSTPLAEVRTDGNRVEFIVDNTDGVLPQEVGGSYERLMKLANGSSHIRLQQPQKATVNLIRYVMDNGDVVEITSDGRTCMLNGELLDEARKNALFVAIRRGEIKVARKADKPVPVIPTQPTTAQAAPEPPHQSREVIGLLADMHARQKQIETTYSGRNDPAIEQVDRSYSDDPAFSKAMAYYAKHGTGGGRA